MCLSGVVLSSEFRSVVGPISQHCMALYLIARAVALIVWRPQVRELVQQIAVRPNLISCHLPISEYRLVANSFEVSRYIRSVGAISMKQTLRTAWGWSRHIR